MKAARTFTHDGVRYFPGDPVPAEVAEEYDWLVSKPKIKKKKDS